MNTSEKVEEIDYEPDVLRFKKIWEEIKDTSQEKQHSSPPPVNPNKTTKIPKQNASSKPTSTQNKPVKKQAIVSSKNVQRNPKPNP